MLFFFDEDLAFDGVAIKGSGSVATSEAAGCSAGGLAGGGWDEVLAVAAGVGIGGSDGSLGVNLLSIIRAKYRNSSMLVSWATTLSCFWSCSPCFSFIALSSTLKNDEIAEDVFPGVSDATEDSIATHVDCFLSPLTPFSFNLNTYGWIGAGKNSLGSWRGFCPSRSPKNQGRKG